RRCTRRAQHYCARGAALGGANAREARSVTLRRVHDNRLTEMIAKQANCHTRLSQLRVAASLVARNVTFRTPAAVHCEASVTKRTAIATALSHVSLAICVPLGPPGAQNRLRAAVNIRICGVLADDGDAPDLAATPVRAADEAHTVTLHARDGAISQYVRLGSVEIGSEPHRDLVQHDIVHDFDVSLGAKPLRHAPRLRAMAFNHGSDPLAP